MTNRIKALICAAAMAVSGGLSACSDSSSGESPSAGNVSSAAESTASQSDESSEAAAKPAAEMDTSMTALELCRVMGNGINLGNTMEAYGHKSYVKGKTDPRSCENNWGQPTTTKEMIEGMKAAGFDSLRIPVAWTNAMDFENGDYTIDPLYLDRVEEIINYALDSDMYVIINDHWDGGWWGMFGSAAEATRQKAMDLYTSMWEQLCERYGSYDEHLIFESANEELGDRLNDKDYAPDSGTLSKTQCYEKLLEINQRFVDTVRASGGNNANRFLLIAGYNTDVELTCNEKYKLPTDTVKDRMLVSVHYYTPWPYCGETGQQSWGIPNEVEQMNGLMEKLTKFTEQGYGVVIGEYAVAMNGKTPKPDTDRFITNLLNNCDLYNYVPMLWDCNGLYDKYSKKIKDETISEIYSSRRYSSESGKSEDQLKTEAQEALDKFYQEAEDAQAADVSIPASDDKAVAWIMYTSGDYNVNYCASDNYDPTSMTAGVKAENVEITGDGTYEVSLDFSKAGGAHGIAFSALGISNGEELFPGCLIKIEEIKVNGQPIAMTAQGYTSSDNGSCTRVNLLNQWVGKVPEGARSIDGSVENAKPVIVDKEDFSDTQTLSVKFTFKTAEKTEE
ncbi:MAG: glycoside hydrolase family 5 protein [Ruminococcus sp.]|nr:glycoside hydrolase family 5 protein [Ruminococcus sp.]